MDGLRRRPWSGRSSSRRAPAPQRDDHLLPVGYRSREIDELESCLRPWASGRADGIVYPTSVVQTVEPGLTDGTDNVHE
jgi:hypothetical protein